MRKSKKRLFEMFDTFGISIYAHAYNVKQLV